MSLATNVTNLATRMATEAKSLRTLINGNQTSLSGLTTTAKSTLVDAINEVNGSLANAGAKIDDTVSNGTTTTWSSSKSTAAISAAVASLVNTAPATMDTLNELASALANDPNFATTMTSQLSLKAPLASPTFTGLVTVPDANFPIAKTSGLQAALNAKVTAFADPNVDAIMFWDDSAGAFAALSLANLTITGTSMAVNASSETAAGVVEQATLAEVTTGTDALRYVTPQGVRQEINTRAPTSHTHTASQVTDFTTATLAAVPVATTAVQGKVFLATSAEATTGTDAAKAITAAAMKAVTDTKAALVHGHALTDTNMTGILPIAQVPTGTSASTVALGNHTHTSAAITDFTTAVNTLINSLVPAASTTVAGKAKVATDALITAGTDALTFVTPAGLRTNIGDPETDYVAVFNAALV